MPPGKVFDTYNGGKNGAGVYQAIINQIPPHDVFISGFAGNCGVMANKMPAPIANVAVDADAAVTDKWRMLPGISVRNCDVISCLADLVAHFTLMQHRTFIYLDPPYLDEVRNGVSRTSLYKYEMLQPEQHERLLRSITDKRQMLEANICITHYPCKLYDTVLKDWRKVKFKAMTRIGMRIDCMYMNYAEPTELHDYSYIGNDFRERELFKKAAKNWRNKFLKMPPLEQSYFLHTIKQTNATRTDYTAGAAAPALK